MNRLRLVALWSPPIVVFTWAALALAGIEGRTVTVLGRLLLGLAFAAHVWEEMRVRPRYR